eukprot:10153520-Karenia_brevis.AAC.1
MTPPPPPPPKSGQVTPPPPPPPSRSQQDQWKQDKWSMNRWDNKPWGWESTMEVEGQPSARESLGTECYPENPQEQEWVSAQVGFTDEDQARRAEELSWP